jgi:acyl-CoA thioesterase-1
MRVMVPLHGLYGRLLRQRQYLARLFVILLTITLSPFSAAWGQAQAVRLLALGDSLTAGYNLPADAAFPAQLEKALREAGLNVTAINAGVSGDTSAGALSRLDWSLADKPTHALVALGANDMLRGLSPENAQANIEKIVTKLQSAGVKVMLVGMLAAPNLGEDYGRRFNALYPALAEKYKLPLYPFFLDGVATRRDLTLDDGMHPNRAGVAEMVKRMLPSVTAWLKG